MSQLVLSLDEIFQVPPVHVRISHQTGDPDIVLREEALNGLNFVDRAAEVGVLFPHPFLFRHFVLGRMWADWFDVHAEELGQAILVFQGLGEMEAGIDEVHRRSRTYLGQVIEQDRGTRAEAGSDEHPFEVLIDLVDPLFVAERAIFPVEGFEFFRS